MDNTNPATESVILDLYRRLVTVVSKRWWAIVIALVVIVTGASAYVVRAPREYEARASVVIDSATPQVLGGQFRDVIDVEMGSWWSAREYIQTQYNVLRSESLANEVAARLEKTGELTKFKLGEGESGRRALASVLVASIQVEGVKESRVVNLIIRYTDPNLATILANAVADTYIDENLQRRLSSTRNTASWLGDQLVDLKKQLETSELELYEFKRENNILSVSLEDNRNILSNEIQKLADAASEAKTKKIQLAARRKILIDLRSDDPVDNPTPDPKDGDVISKLRETYADQSAKLLELKGKYLDKHPLVLAQEARLQAVREDLRKESQRAYRNIDAQYSLAVETEKNLLAALDAAKQQALALNKKQIEYDRLKRSAESNAKLYDLVLGRLKESDLAGQIRSNNVRWLDRARVPGSPVAPNIPTILMLAVVLGLGTGLSLAFLLDYLDNTVKSQEDVENAVRLPLLGIIPTIAAENGAAQLEPLHIVEHSKSMVAECCRAIRTNILFMSPERPFKSLLVTSSGPQEGKSTTTINLGISMAQSGNRVLLIDTDMRRPRLHRAFGVSCEMGVSTLILGESPMSDVIKSTEVPNLWIMPCGPLPPNPAELLHTNRFREMLEQVQDRFDRIVFDSPPLGAVTDAAVLSTHVDGVVLVAKCGRTTREMMIRCRRQLEDVKANVLGCVLNDIDPSRPTYGYNYYHYYQRYGYYYGSDEKSNPQTSSTPS
jgi:capsular exopolysaccharide synthesis family protein